MISCFGAAVSRWGWPCLEPLVSHLVRRGYELPAALSKYARAALMSLCGDVKLAGSVLPSLFKAADKVELTSQERYFVACALLLSPQGTNHMEVLLEALTCLEKRTLLLGTAKPSQMEALSRNPLQVPHQPRAREARPSTELTHVPQLHPCGSMVMRRHSAPTQQMPVASPPQQFREFRPPNQAMLQLPQVSPQLHSRAIRSEYETPCATPALPHREVRSWSAGNGMFQAHPLMV